MSCQHQNWNEGLRTGKNENAQNIKKAVSLIESGNESVRKRRLDGLTEVTLVPAILHMFNTYPECHANIKTEMKDLEQERMKMLKMLRRPFPSLKVATRVQERGGWMDWPKSKMLKTI